MTWIDHRDTVLDKPLAKPPGGSLAPSRPVPSSDRPSTRRKRATATLAALEADELPLCEACAEICERVDRLKRERAATPRGLKHSVDARLKAAHAEWDQIGPIVREHDRKLAEARAELAKLDRA
jgi:hypothetical protein